MGFMEPSSASARHREPRQAVLFALLAVAAWSTVATGFKLGLEVLEPVQLLFLGSVMSALLFALLASLGGHWQVQRAPWKSGFVLGLLNPCLYYLVLFEAYDRLPAQIAQPLNYTWAVTLALLAVPVLGQPLTRPVLLGLLTSYLGVVVLLTGGRFGTLPALDWLGVALALGSTVIWAGYWLANARSTLPAVTLMAWSFLLAAPLLGIACWLGPGLPPLRPDNLFYGAWVGLVEMGFAFLCWQRAMRLTDNAGRIGQLIFLSPFLSLALIGAVLGESIRVSSVAGLAIIVAGLWVSQRS